MKEIAGYCISLEAAVRLAANLHIDIGEPTKFNQIHMEWPINDWLYDNGMLHVKAALLEWPRRGMLFLTKCCEITSRGPVDALVEEAKDLEVKDWLKRNGASDAVWVSLEDRYRITLSGDKPERTGTKFKEYATMEEFMKNTGLSSVSSS